MAADEKAEYDDLRSRTEEYHEFYRCTNGEQKAWRFYLENSKLRGETGSHPPLLQLEMEYAQKHGRLPFPLPNTTLVILLGETFEPLLQSIWAHEPTHLIPIVNTYYGDIDDKNSSREMWGSFYHLLQKLPGAKKRKIGNLATLRNIDPVPDDPTQVFEHLRKKLQEPPGIENRHVVIDITGAKKTMVAGAFMFAAYTQTTINYVDTEKQGENKQPLGFTCHFRQIKSPLDELMLHVWQQIEDRYTRYDFAGALQLLNHAIPQTALGGSSLKDLQTFLHICHEWDNGQLQQAFHKLTDLPGELKRLVPTAVFALGSYWPKENKTELNPSFFCHPEAIEVFARDELARARRLTTPHTEETPVVTQLAYKAAFARAYALYETLLKARLAVLYCVQERVNQTVSYDALLPKVKKTPKVIRDGLIQAQPVHLLPELDVYNTNQPDLEKLKDARNLATHNYFPIEPDLARQAIALAEKSLENYLAEWKPLMTDVIRQRYGIEPLVVNPLNLERPEWQKLRTMCQLYFIPQKNQEAI